MREIVREVMLLRDKWAEITIEIFQPPILNELMKARI
jgi:hypothetical protein